MYKIESIDQKFDVSMKTREKYDQNCTFNFQCTDFIYVSIVCLCVTFVNLIYKLDLSNEQYGH